MPRLLARMLTPGRWQRPAFVREDDFQADAVTADLKTTQNKLSFWRCEETDESLDDVFLALASGRDKLGPVKIVILEEDALVAAGLQFEESPGRTPVEDLRARHCDAALLTYGSLRPIAAMIQRLVEGAQVKSAPQAEVKRLLRSALAENRVSLHDLAQDIQHKLNPV